jgi:hypothetical protein
MQQNSTGISLGEAEFNNLCSHYKDTYEIHLSSIKQRDTLFYALLVILAFFSLQVTSTDLVNGALSNYINKEFGVTVDKSSNLFGTMLWLLVFGVSSRYYQIVIQIERQYGYIHHLEDLLNKKYTGSRVFTREGEDYLDKYPLFSNWVCFLYTAAFPLIILLSIVLRIQVELARIEILGLGLAPSFVCYLLVGTSTILYIANLHGTALLKLLTISSSGLRKIWRILLRR